jgi:SAM-dependent methyltransferase
MEKEDQATAWDIEYEKGEWNRLMGADQYPRYGFLSVLIVEQFQQIGRALRILDVGAGEGLILNHLPKKVVDSYTAFDISEAALAKIPKQPGNRTICGNLRSWVPKPEAMWDVILFNEVLYYLDDPVASFERLSRNLAPKGVLMTSHYLKPGWRSRNKLTEKLIERRLSSDYSVLRKELLSNRLTGKAWSIIVASPKVWKGRTRISPLTVSDSASKVKRPFTLSDNAESNLPESDRLARI